MFTKSLTMDGKKNVVILGKGMDKTIFNWKNQTEGAEGLHVSNGVNVVFQDFLVEDLVHEEGVALVRKWILEMR